jgi:hypothetical protein
MEKTKEELSKSKLIAGKKAESEVAQRLTQRLYASYSESQILIPNEVS